MFYDQRGGWLDTARYGLQAAIYPLQLAVNSPSAAWRWLEESFTTRETLQKEVDTLRNQLRDQQLMTCARRRSRGKRHAARPQPARCPTSSRSGSSARSSASRSRRCASGCWSIAARTSGVYKAQPVVTGDGVLGQVFRTRSVQHRDHPDHRRRTRAAGAGAALRRAHHRAGHRATRTALELPYVPQNYDVKVGDVLVTSGLGRVFPFGLPVARVTSVERDPAPSRWRRSSPRRSRRSTPIAKCCSSGRAPIIRPRPPPPKRWRSKRPSLRRRRRRHRNLPPASRGRGTRRRGTGADRSAACPTDT